MPPVMARRPISAISRLPVVPVPMRPLPVSGGIGVETTPGPGVFSPATVSVGSGVFVGVAVGSGVFVGVAVGEGVGVTPGSRVFLTFTVAVSPGPGLTTWPGVYVTLNPSVSVSVTV